MMSRVEDVPAELVKIGMQVEAKIIVEDGKNLIVFVPRG
jgi:uncharacterized OB-fold protein